MGHNKLRLLVIVLGFFLILTTIRSIAGMWGGGARVTDEETKVEKLRAENTELKRQVAVASSAAYVEKQARDKLNMGLPGEEVVIISPKAYDSGTIQPVPIDEPNWQKWLTLFLGS